MFQVELKQDDTPSRRTIFHRLGKHKRRWRPCPRRLALLFPALPPPRINNETRESSRVAAVARTKEEKDQQIAIYGCAQKTKWDTAKGHYFRLIGSARSSWDRMEREATGHRIRRPIQHQTEEFPAQDMATRSNGLQESFDRRSDSPWPVPCFCVSSTGLLF